MSERFVSERLGERSAMELCNAPWLFENVSIENNGNGVPAGGSEGNGRRINSFGIACFRWTDFPILHFGRVDVDRRRTAWEKYKESAEYRTDPRVKPCDWVAPEINDPRVNHSEPANARLHWYVHANTVHMHRPMNWACFCGGWVFREEELRGRRGIVWKVCPQGHLWKVLLGREEPYSTELNEIRLQTLDSVFYTFRRSPPAHLERQLNAIERQIYDVHQNWSFNHL